MDIKKEHIIAGVVGGVVSLALAAMTKRIVKKGWSGCCSKASGDSSETPQIITMTSFKIPAAIGPYTPGKMIQCCGIKYAISSGQIGIDPITKKLAGDDIET